MKVGMNLLLWTSQVTDEHAAILETLAETGFDGVEVPLAPLDVAHYQRLGERIAGLGMKATARFSPGPDEDPASADAAMRRRALDRFRWLADAAAALNAEVVGGPLHSAYGVFKDRGPTAEDRAFSAEVLREAAGFAQANGVRLAIEHLNRFESYLVSTVADAVALAELVDHDNLGVHYDTHHAHIEEKSVADAIGRCASRLRHVHISENDRGTPGRGQVDWDETFNGLKRAGYDDWLVIEAFSTADPAFARAIHVWRDLQSVRRDPARGPRVHPRPLGERLGGSSAADGLPDRRPTCPTITSTKETRGLSSPSRGYNARVGGLTRSWRADHAQPCRPRRGGLLCPSGHTVRGAHAPPPSSAGAGRSAVSPRVPTVSSTSAATRRSATSTASAGDSSRCPTVTSRST